MCARDVVHDEIAGISISSGRSASDNSRRFKMGQHADFAIKTVFFHFAKAMEQFQRDDFGLVFQPPCFVNHAETTASDFAYNLALGDSRGVRLLNESKVGIAAFRAGQQVAVQLGIGTVRACKRVGLP